MTAHLRERPMATSRPEPGPCPTIETARLVLRPHRLSDADAVAQSLNDYQVSGMLARVPVPYHRQDAVEWIMRQNAGVPAGWSLAITDGDDVHIGCVGIELRHGRWHVGYWLNRYYWGRGYAGEAVHAALERFFRRMPGTVVHSGVFADNAASLKLQKTLGFTITGCTQVYAMARNGMTSHIETQITAADLHR